MGRRYKRKSKPKLEHLTIGGVIEYAEALNTPYKNWNYWKWWDFAEFADALEGLRKTRQKAREERERLVTDWLLVKDKPE